MSLYEEKFFDAREAAFDAYMEMELAFKHAEIVATHTKLSTSKKGGILWARVGRDNAMKIFARAAVICGGKKKDLPIMNKMPTQYWERSRSLEKILYEVRNKNPNLRTQVRIGVDDLELFIKAQA